MIVEAVYSWQNWKANLCSILSNICARCRRHLLYVYIGTLLLSGEIKLTWTDRTTRVMQGNPWCADSILYRSSAEYWRLLSKDLSADGCYIGSRRYSPASTRFRGPLQIIRWTLVTLKIQGGTPNLFSAGNHEQSNHKRAQVGDYKSYGPAKRNKIVNRIDQQTEESLTTTNLNFVHYIYHEDWELKNHAFSRTGLENRLHG